MSNARDIRPRRVFLFAVALAVASCTSTGTTDPPPTVTSTTATTQPPSTVASTTTQDTTTIGQGLVAVLPSCDGDTTIPAANPAGQVGFVKGGAAYVVDPDGTNVQCVTEVAANEPFVWGPAADRLVVGDVVISEGASAPVLPAARPTWSRPTGTSLVWVQGGRLLKASRDGTEIRDLSFLDEHEAVTYHPAGVEIATTGTATDGTRGVWLSSNEGDDPRLIVRADEATAHEFTFNHDGVSARFLADHGDVWHVHEIFLVLPEDEPAANEFDATIDYESAGPLSNLVVSPWDWLWAGRDGVCGSGSAVVIGAAELPPAIAELDSFPVGWLPEQRLVVGSYANGCDGAIDLWVIDVATDGASEATLLITDVDGAAVRAAVPDPPPPLGDVSLDDFA